MALTTQERSARRDAKRRKQGIEELRLSAMAGTRAALADLMAWHGIEQQAEALTLMIHNLHAMGRDQSAAAFAVPQHKVKVTQNVARHIREAGEQQSRRLDQDD